MLNTLFTFENERRTHVETIKTPDSFDIIDFMDSFVDDFNNESIDMFSWDRQTSGSAIYNKDLLITKH